MSIDYTEVWWALKDVFLQSNYEDFEDVKKDIRICLYGKIVKNSKTWKGHIKMCFYEKITET